MGSFVPWLYYSFYCSPQPRLIYLSIVCVLGIAAIVVAQWDRFSTPRHRPTRAGVHHQHTHVATFEHVLLVSSCCYCRLSCRDLFLDETRMMKCCSCLRCVHGSWIEWDCPDHALHYRGGLREGHYCRTDGLVLPDGCHVHHWCWSVCSQDPWALLSWQMWHLGKHSMILPIWMRRYLKSLFSWI